MGGPTTLARTTSATDNFTLLEPLKTVQDIEKVNFDKISMSFIL